MVQIIRRGSSWNRAEHIRPARVGEGGTRWPACSTRRRRHPEQGPNVRRTPERRIRDRKAQHGPEQEVMFRQRHEPGRRLACLHPSRGARRRLAGRKPGHMPCHFRLPWSGFRHAGQVSAARASRRWPKACRRRSGSRAGPRASTGQATCRPVSAIIARRMPGI